jgi:hypothetical protein
MALVRSSFIMKLETFLLSLFAAHVWAVLAILILI